MSDKERLRRVRQAQSSSSTMFGYMRGEDLIWLMDKAEQAIEEEDKEKAEKIPAFSTDTINIALNYSSIHHARNAPFPFYIEEKGRGYPQDDDSVIEISEEDAWFLSVSIPKLLDAFEKAKEEE